MNPKKSENVVVKYNTTFISDLNDKHIVEFPTQTLTKANKATFRKKSILVYYISIKIS